MWRFPASTRPSQRQASCARGTGRSVNPDLDDAPGGIPAIYRRRCEPIRRLAMLDALRGSRLRLEPVVAVPAPTARERHCRRGEVEEPKERAVSAPLTDVLELVGQLHGAQVAPREDVPPDGDRQPVAQEPAAERPKPWPDVEAMGRLRARASAPIRGGDGLIRPAPAGGRAGRANASGNGRSCGG